MDANEKLKGRKDDELSLRHVKFTLAQKGDPPRQLEKQNKTVIEKSVLELIIQIRAFEKNVKSFPMIFIWVFIKILQ